MSAAIRRERSTKVAWRAPRERDSMPTAPEPAHKSRKRAPAILGARILNNVSRRRSDVGLVASDGGLFSRRPRNVPAITRMLRQERKGQSAKCKGQSAKRKG